MTPASKGPPWSAGIWVLAVVAVGLALGAVLALSVHVPPGPPPGSPRAPPPAPQALTQAAVLLSTLCLVLLSGLVAVYIRSFRATKAPYVLGLVIFLSALLLETALSSPLLFTAFGTGPGSLSRFLVPSELLESAALAIFLYLSL